jgi:hypothetical protein
MVTVIESRHSIKFTGGVALLAKTYGLISLVVYVFEYANNFLKA